MKEDRDAEIWRQAKLRAGFKNHLATYLIVNSMLWGIWFFSAGGHSYPWIYSGPIGAIITPQFHGVSQDPWLPFASSLCGACAEVCPVKIQIPELLLKLRADVTAAKERKGEGGMERFAFKMYAWVACHPKLFALGGSVAAKLAFRNKATGMMKLPGFMQVGPLKKWLSERELPAPAPKSFRRLWRERQRAKT